MTARGDRSLGRTHSALAAHVNHAGTIGALPHKQLARRTGHSARQEQRNVLTLERSGRIRATRVRGYANAYRVLLPWVLPMIEGEARAADGEAAASDPPPAPPQTPRRPLIPYAVLDHHPTQ
jgi:hypothetical protein